MLGSDWQLKLAASTVTSQLPIGIGEREEDGVAVFLGAIRNECVVFDFRSGKSERVK